MPAPPARIASANVPCGSSSASISPARGRPTASGFDVKYEPIAVPMPALPQQLAETATRLADVVRDHGQISRLGDLGQCVDQRQRGADEPEAADHDRVAVADPGATASSAVTRDAHGHARRVSEALPGASRPFAIIRRRMAKDRMA